MCKMYCNILLSLSFQSNNYLISFCTKLKSSNYFRIINYVLAVILVLISIDVLLVCRSQMIGDDDYRFITDFINSDATRRETLLADQRTQCAKTFLSLLEHISKDQTVQYILTIMDDLLQVLLLLGFTICHSLTD